MEGAYKIDLPLVKENTIAICEKCKIKTSFL